MAKLKKAVIGLILMGLLFPFAAGATEPEDCSGNIIEVPVYDMDILPGTWNPLSDMTPEKEFLLEMTSDRLYRLEDGVLTPSMAAAMPRDVTADYAGTFGIPADAVRGYAFSVDLNEKACWEDGAAITSGDWLFTIEAYRSSEKFYVNLAADEVKPDIGTVVSLADAGFATVAEAREAGHVDFYLDITRFWGLEGGWKSVEDRTRYRDYAIPSGMDEFYVTPAYLYGRYLAEGAVYERWQPDMIGISTATATEQKSGIFATGDHQITLILSRPTTATALALELMQLRPIRESLWSAEYATSPADYSACGPYRVETVEQGLIVLVRNGNWYGAVDALAPEVIRCKTLG